MTEFFEILDTLIVIGLKSIWCNFVIYYDYRYFR